MQCKICNEIFRSNKDLSIHIRYKHKIQSKTYYDAYLKKKMKVSVNFAINLQNL